MNPVNDIYTDGLDDDVTSFRIKNTQENIDLINKVDVTWWFEEEGVDVAVIGTDMEGRRAIILYLNEHASDPYLEGEHPQP